MSTLTGAERTKARSYLGYPNLFRFKNTRLESTFEQLDADAEVLFRAYLVQLVAADTAIGGSLAGVGGSSSTSTATIGQSIKKVDEIEFYAAGSSTSSSSEPAKTGIDWARSIGREYAGKLSILLGVPLYSDYFAEGGYLGDTFSEGGLASGSPHGGPFGLG